jgi:hypothetical protein
VRLYLALVRFNPSTIERFATFSEDAFAKLRRRSEIYGKYERLVRHDEAPNVAAFSTATDTNPTPLSAQDLDDLRTGALAFFAMGLFQYSDAFKGSYETQFCYYFFGGNQRDLPWHICDSHNTIQ